jgi:hypothetical protein
MNVYQHGIEEDREEVRRLLGAIWREQVAVLQINRFHPGYSVPGRRTDGTSVDQPPQPGDTGPIPVQSRSGHTSGNAQEKHPVLVGIGVVAIAIAVPVLWIATALSGGTWQAATVSSRRKNRRNRAPDYPLSGIVRGPAGCMALAFADTATAHPRKLWLAWSPSWLALVQATGQPHIVWQARGVDRPIFDRDKFRLSWPDQSSVAFQVPRDERKRFKQRQGT